MEQNIKVIVRLRPAASPSPVHHDDDLTINLHRDANAALIDQNDPNSVLLMSKPKPKAFSFDYVAGPNSTQYELFQHVGKPITDRCISGYNGTIFAYGQTGSGKTFTMQGPLELNESNWEDRGLIPRILEYLFDRISEIESENGNKIKFLVKCSYLEIYNENLTDLFDPNASSSPIIREDVKLGVTVQNLKEEIVSNAAEALDKMEIGSRNRKVASTFMNNQSSRSHSVFTIHFQSEELKEDGQNLRTRTSRFHLVDLAGSERQKDTGTTGEHLKEAGSINRSLLSLGNVITALVDVANGKHRYVRYRDSKLTFLLKDSLGGNSLTYLIAAISPSSASLGETLSTLKFAGRAKDIKNQAIINEIDHNGASNEYLVQENAKLRDKIRELQKTLEDLGDVQMQSSANPAQSNSADDLISDILQQNEDYREVILKLRSKIENLQQLCDAFGQKQVSNVMIRKLQRKYIQKLESSLKNYQNESSDQRMDSLQQIIDSQTIAYMNEVERLEEQISRAPSDALLKLERIEIEEKRRDISDHSLDKFQYLKDFNEKLSSKCVALLELNDRCTSELDYLREKLKSYDVHDGSDGMLAVQSGQFQKMVADMQLNLSVQEQKVLELEGQISSQSVSMNKMRELHEMELNDLKSALEQELKRNEETVNSLKESLVEAQRNKDLSENELKDASRKISEQERIIENLNRSFSTLKENERNAHENVTLNEQLDELSSKFKDLETQNVEFKAKVDEYESALKLKNDELSDLLNIKEKLESELSSLQTEILRVTGDLDEKSRIIARNLDRIKLLESELESISVESSTLKQNLFNSERGLAASSSALSELQFQFESLKEDYDEVEEQRSFLQDELNLKLQELELVKSQASLGAAKDGLVETLNAEICSLTQKLEGHESLRAKYNEMETQNSMLNDKISNLQNEISLASERERLTDTLKNNLETQVLEIQHLRESKDQLTKELERIRCSLAEKDLNLSNLQLANQELSHSLQTIASVDENLKQKYLDQQRLIEKFVLLSKSVSHQKSMIKEVQSDALRDLSAYFSEFSKLMENAKSIHLKESQATSELTERIDSLEKVKSDLERKIQGKSVQYEELYEILNNAKSEILMIAESQNIPVSVDGDSGFEVLDSLRYIFDDLTADMNLLRDENEKLRSESTNFKRENTELSAKVAKLENEKEQLEISYQVLEDQMNQLKSDVENERNNNQKLNEQNTFLLGHQNPNQKIQHIKQLKDEVTSFKKRCREQEMLIRKYKRVCGGNVELSDDEQNLLTEKSSANDENGNIDPNLSSHLKRYNLRNH